jgi:hypothetical protein
MKFSEMKEGITGENAAKWGTERYIRIRRGERPLKNTFNACL